jgi:hypothetical protein
MPQGIAVAEVNGSMKAAQPGLKPVYRITVEYEGTSLSRNIETRPLTGSGRTPT